VRPRRDKGGQAIVDNVEAGAAPKTKDQPQALEHAPGTPIITVFQDALAICERLARSDPSNAMYRDGHGDAVAAPRKARAIITQLIAIEPNNEQWQKNLSWFDNQIAKAEG
jgi:hypothetical protein